VSLFLAVGAMAQTPVVTVSNIGTAPFQLSDEDAAKIFELENLTVVLDVTTAASLSGRGAFFCVADPAQAVPGSFSGSNTSFMACGHVNTSIAYIAAAKDGQHFSTGTIPANSTIRIAYVFDKTNNKFKSYIGDTNTGWTMDRDFGTYEIATPKMVKADFANANIYIGGGMANNANHELGDATIHKVRVYNGTLTVDEIKALDFVKEISDFENGKIYTFVTERGWMGAKDGNDKVISTAYTANDVTGSKTDENFQWTVYKSINNKYYLYNVGKEMFMGVESANNTAVPFAATPQGLSFTFKKSSNAAYPIMFSTDNAGVVNHSGNHASGLITWTGGWNTLDDGGSNHKVEAVGTLDSETLADIAELVAAYEAENVLVYAGKYYTFNQNGNYITSEVANSRIACSTTKDASAIYYFDGERLLAYKTGLYIGLNVSDWTFEAIGSNDISAIEFVAAANGAEEKCNIKSGGRWLHLSANGDGSTFVNRCSANTCGNAHNWAIEAVEALPVTISAAKYATFYAPVAVTVPEGVTAYTATIDAANDRVELNEIGGVIPANTGVVLYSETAGTYNFTITENVEAIASGLRGSAAATYYTTAGTYYALAVVKGEVGFYKDAFNNSRFQNNSHKAYLYVEGTQNAASYSFRFGEGTTGISEVKGESGNVKVIFDLTGRRVENITAPGIYIINGVKVLVK
ncbi:MAG: hypothetical protein II198_01065, partial [Bacteroidaceae bacterium]|nr:hypothetical protein [Bacteroidaceae bacterium]